MRQHNHLGRDLVALLELPDGLGYALGVGRVIIDGIDTETSVAATEAEPFGQAHDDAFRVVGGGVRLRPVGDGAGLANLGVALRRVVDAGGSIHQIHSCHQLGDGGRHLTGEVAG